MRIKLRKMVTGQIKYITKPDDYPVRLGDEIRFRKWHDNYDIWLVIAFWKKPKEG